MKQSIDYSLLDLTDHEREFLKLWKKRKYNDESPVLSVGDLWELLIALKGVRHEVSVIDELAAGSYFNNTLHTEDLVIAWEGDEPVDIFFFNVRKELKRILSRTKVFSDQEYT